MSIEGQGHFFILIFQVLYILCFTRPRYQVSVYGTIGPLVNNLLLSLPNPENALLKSINEIFYNFLWNKKVKIKRSVVVKQYCEGGLKMINIEAFSYALKATWIRRLITDNCKWQDYILKYVDLEKNDCCRCKVY